MSSKLQRNANKFIRVRSVKQDEVELYKELLLRESPGLTFEVQQNLFEDTVDITATYSNQREHE